MACATSVFSAGSAGAALMGYDVILNCASGCVGSFDGGLSYDTNNISGGFAPLDSFSFDILGVVFDETDTVTFAGAGVDASGNLQTFSIQVYDVVSGVSINLLAANSTIWQAGGVGTSGALPDMTGTTSYSRTNLASSAPIPEPSAILVFSAGMLLLRLRLRQSR